MGYPWVTYMGANKKFFYIINKDNANKKYNKILQIKKDI